MSGLDRNRIESRGHRGLCVAFALLCAAGCESQSAGLEQSNAGPSGAPVPAAAPGAGGSAGAFENVGMGTGASAPSSGSAGTGGDFGSDTGASAGDPSGEGASGDGAAEDAGVADPIAIEPGQLTAGEWSDLANWDFWRDLHEPDDCNDGGGCATGSPGSEMSSHWGYDTEGRIAVRVRHGSDPVVDAHVTLLDDQQVAVWSARTDSQGRAELFAGLFADSDGAHSVRVEAAGERVEASEVQLGNPEPVEIDFPVAYVPAPALDLMFVIDTTGSMGDELRYIQAELGNVIARVRDEIGSQLQVRLSVNFYRDRGDEYVVRDFQFTTDVEQALSQLAAQQASGGGDTPEAAEEALDNAVRDHAWSEAATARLLFFVLDAPPHHDESRLEQLHGSTRAAAEQGVQIVPLAASGIDESTEFLLRNLAVATGGTYAFLTDHSGIGNAHLEPTIGDYEVELLGDLMVRVIRERL